MNPNDNSQAATKAKLEQFVVFRLDDEAYAVPILTVVEVISKLDITPVPTAPNFILGLTNLRGRIIPVLDLEKKFNLSHSAQSVHRHIMIAQNEQKDLFGILVDEVTKVLKIMPDAIKPSPGIVTAKISAEYLGGVILLAEDKQKVGDEQMVLVLNLQKILSDKNITELRLVPGARGPVASSS